MTILEQIAPEEEMIGHETMENSDALAKRLELSLLITEDHGRIK